MASRELAWLAVSLSACAMRPPAAHDGAMAARQPPCPHRVDVDALLPVMGRAIPPLEPRNATQLRAVPAGTFLSGGSLRLLGAGAGVLWFTEKKDNGTTTLLEITPWPALSSDEGGDPEPPDPASTGAATLFRRDVEAFSKTSQILAGVGVSGAIGVIESRARGGSGLVDWTPSRYHLYHSSGEKGIDVALDWPNVIVHSIAIKAELEMAPMLSVSVAGGQKFGSSEIVASRGGRVHAIVQLNVDGSPRWATPVEDLDPDVGASGGADMEFVSLLSTARDPHGSAVLVSMLAGAGGIRWVRTIRSRREGEPELEPGMLQGPYIHRGGIALAGYLTGLDFGDGALSSDLSDAVVSLDGWGNLSWARAVDERILAVSTDSGDIQLLTQNPRSGDAAFYTLDPDGSVTTMATVPWPEECGLESVFAFEASAIYWDGRSPAVAIQCTTYERGASRATRLFAYSLVP